MHEGLELVGSSTHAQTQKRVSEAKVKQVERKAEDGLESLMTQKFVIYMFLDFCFLLQHPRITEAK